MGKFHDRETFRCWIKEEETTDRLMCYCFVKRPDTQGLYRCSAWWNRLGRGHFFHGKSSRDCRDRKCLPFWSVPNWSWLGSFLQISVTTWVLPGAFKPTVPKIILDGVILCQKQKVNPCSVTLSWNFSQFSKFFFVFSFQVPKIIGLFFWEK